MIRYARLADVCDHNRLRLELATKAIGLELRVVDPRRGGRISAPFDVRNPDVAAEVLLEKLRAIHP